MVNQSKDIFWIYLEGFKQPGCANGFSSAVLPALPLSKPT